MISLIYARSLNYCIGTEGRIPWHLPDDFAHFKKTTMGKPIIMGRKTYEDHRSALPGRLNVVVSTQKNYQVVEGVRLVHSLDEAIQLGEQESEEIFIIGGVSFFVQTMSSARVVYETVVETQVVGDAILPEFDFSDWKTELLQDHGIDDKHRFAFKVYKHSRE